MDDETALTAARAFGSPVAPLRQVRAGPSPLFDVTLADGRRVALRLHTDTAARVIADRVRLAEALADAAFATPWPQRTREGGLIHEADGFIATALHWVAARPLALAPCGPARSKALHDLGALLADFHLTADAVAPAALVLPDLRLRVPSCIDAPDVPASDRDMLDAVLSRAQSDLVGASTGIVMGGGSVLSGDDGLWVIGLDRHVGTGWRAMDLADPLWSHAAAADFTALRDALAAGYIAGGGARSAASAERVALCLALRAVLAFDPAGPDGSAALARALAFARAVPQRG